MRVSYSGVRVDVPVLLAVSIDAWDDSTQRVKKNRTNSRGISAADINSAINELEGYIEDIFKSYEVQKIVPSAEMLKKAIRLTVDSHVVRLTPKKDEVSLFEALDLFVKENSVKRDWTHETMIKFDALRNDLKEFNPKLDFDDLTEEGLTALVQFYREQKVLKIKDKTDDGKRSKKNKVGVKNTTIGKKLDLLKWFLKWSRDKGYNKCFDYATFRPKLKTAQKQVVFYTEEEIQRLCEFQIPEDKKHLNKIRDVFVFCCYSSLRYSDVKNLKKCDVKDNFIGLTTIKTADTLRIDYNNVTSRILEKYKDVPIIGGYALPVISNQKMNEQLKELMQLAGFTEEIKQVEYCGNERIEIIKQKWEYTGTHTGRRSFICNALARGIPADVVMKWTGHSDYKSMKPYIDIADSIKAKEMSKFNDVQLAIMDEY